MILPKNGEILEQEIIPFVLHRVTQNQVQNWEDVSKNTLEILISIINSKKLKRKILITFDDGNLSDYDIVFPLLLDAGLTATFFIVSNFIGSTGFLSWSQVREMERYGMNFGSHGANHINLTSLENLAVIDELSTSKRTIEDKLQIEIRQLSFPFGSYSPAVVSLAYIHGYEYCYGSHRGIINQEMNVLPRNSINRKSCFESILNCCNASRITFAYWYGLDFGRSLIKKGIGNDRYLRLREVIFD